MGLNFFTNQNENTLYNKFENIFKHRSDIEFFKAVIGYFRASGYFAIRKHFPENLQIKIIAGINVDPLIALAQKKGLLFSPNAKEIKSEFFDSIHKDISEARYSKEVEDGILLMIEDISNNKIEIRAHNSKKLHSKFYIFLSKNFNEHNPNSTVIMGSSNLSAQGLGLENIQFNYEMNIELQDFANVSFADSEFEKLWQQSTPILPVDAPALIKKQYLEVYPTPFEIYVKFLIEFFGNNIEYDPDSITDIPLKKFKKLSYQIDAVNQGFELLKRYNGFFLADVVGTGKTIMAVLLAKKFIINNGAKTKILVVYPPALEKNWKSTFKEFGIDEKCHFIANGSLNKIVEGDHNYDEKERYDLVLVDEAHKFRNHASLQFQYLQIICKAGRKNIGGVEGFEKKVVLISATPLNNKPDDIYHLISLFQDVRNSTLNISNLQKFFSPLIQEYKVLIRQNPLVIQNIQTVFEKIRDNVIKDITIRRTRTDLMKNERYKNDLINQGVIFPDVAEPFKNEYELNHKLAELFTETAMSIVNKEKIDFFRYQAIAYLTDKENDGTYQNAATVSRSLAFIMQTQLIKRLESSFFAFKKSLNKITTSTKQMIDMYERDSVFIAPDLDISGLLSQGLTDEEIEKKILDIDDGKPKNRVFKRVAFERENVNFDSNNQEIKFIDGLKKDYENLLILNNKWQAIEDSNDPKWNEFIRLLESEYFSKTKNELSKLVIFTESADTLNYLTRRLKDETKYKVLSITSENRDKEFEKIRENFDANYEGLFKNDFDIILTTDVLAEGINLHRANVIVNYDTPWNPTKLIQRLGRINRIGSKAKCIYNYNFYPSEQGDNKINLRQKSLVKLQSSHSTFGEDNKIYTLDEIIDQFNMFEEKAEERDMRTEYLEWLRKFKEQNLEDFNRIKKMPLKVRCIRDIKNAQLSIAFVKNGNSKNIYLTQNNTTTAIPFEKAVKIFEAKAEEKSKLPIPDIHYAQINTIIKQFESDITSDDSVNTFEGKTYGKTNTAIKFISEFLSLTENETVRMAANKLLPLLKNGTITILEKGVNRLRKEKNTLIIEKEIIKIAQTYTSKISKEDKRDSTLIDPKIIISETFI